ncbi:MAG: L-serine ammonia-lyase, iron-sulfur-dependent, subunit alpha [Firmicutes bacterium]|nr:L-serine ammonia-lyase, iron-sulfur-dependent, subunit alpha [Bacillota bacterium]
MKFKFNSAAQWLALAGKTGLDLADVVLRAEMESTGASRDQILEKMRQSLVVMRSSAQKGVHEPVYSRSGLTGGAAHTLAQAIAAGKTLTQGLFAKAALYALSTAEVNASMGRVCAAPTAGSAGVVPAVILALEEELGLTEDAVVLGLVVAAGVGQVAAEYGELVGAALGCQAEIGVASAMAAAGGAYLVGVDWQGCLDAGALALQNLLGLVCDPVAGYVEIPCIARNPSAATNALTCIELVKAGIRSPIPLDDVLLAMVDIGKRLHPDLRETSRGGLAITPSGRRLAEACAARSCPRKRESHE